MSKNKEMVLVVVKSVFTRVCNPSDHLPNWVVIPENPVLQMAAQFHSGSLPNCVAITAGKTAQFGGTAQFGSGYGIH